MDILYILGNGSVHDNMEIRLSLRTVEKYAKNLDRVFIVFKMFHVKSKYEK